MSRYRCVDAQRAASFPVVAGCRVEGVSTSAYYAFAARPSPNNPAQPRLVARSAIHTDSHGTYGSPRVTAELHRRVAGVVGEQGGRMKRPPRDEEREQRITMEIVVDAYTPEEQAMGWYYSLEDRLHFPFVVKCIAERSISPLRVGDEVDVVGMAPEEECEHEMFVLIPWERRTLAVPLAQLQGIAVDEQTRQAIQDWQYWVAQGYEL